MVKNLPANTGDTKDAGLIREPGRTTGVGNGKSLQYSCLEIPWTEEPGGLWSMGCKESDTTEHKQTQTHTE